MAIETPASPVALGNIAVDNAGGILGLAIDGDRAYVADGPRGLRIYDLSGNGAPTLGSEGYTVGNCTGIALDGTMAYASDATTVVGVIDLFANP